MSRNFYVDDGLKSVQSVYQAKELIKNTKHKFNLNSKDVMSSVLQVDQATDLADHRLIGDGTIIECALGVHWCRITLQDKPL